MSVRSTAKLAVICDLLCFGAMGLPHLVGVERAFKDKYSNPFHKQENQVYIRLAFFRKLCEDLGKSDKESFNIFVTFSAQPRVSVC